MIGADWAFAQRFLCVPSKKDARKSAYLFGILYLVSPLLWLLPPMIYRVVDPTADPEQAYILSCMSVLPVGMLGLMVAAMFSATASMVSSQLNVFSGVLTHDLYRPLMRRDDDQHVKLVSNWHFGHMILLARCSSRVRALYHANEIAARGPRITVFAV
jgi:Na+/proline symporter